MRRPSLAILALIAFALIAVASIGLDSEPTSAATTITVTSGEGKIHVEVEEEIWTCVRLKWWVASQGESSAETKDLMRSNHENGNTYPTNPLRYWMKYTISVNPQSTTNYTVKASTYSTASASGCTGNAIGTAQATRAVQPPPQQQPQAAAAYYEVVLRGAVERVSNPGEPEPSSLHFPTRYLSDCQEWAPFPAGCGSLTFPDGVYEALDEAVEDAVQRNIWGSYVVADDVGTAQDWERRFRAWTDTERLGFALEGRRYFALSGRSVFDLDLWIIYYMAERGMNSVRLAERPFDPPLTVCVPLPEKADAGAMLAVWDKENWRWQPLESVVTLDEGQICALTPFATVFSLVEGESVSTSELGQIP